ncbi:leucyl aminopeptidase family protein [Pikeienuella sp. HZG-20]|uniref:leucyl aminopeptidase family protein n=1 Tax=Paludibacillus litoralis TaxID=3133267 RepID=UPI0030EEB0D4
MTPTFADARADAPATPLHLIERAAAPAALDAMPGAEAAWARLQGFSGELGETVLIPDDDGGLKSALFGWGDARARAAKRFAIGGFAAKAPEGVYSLEGALTAEEADEAALGWLLSAYRFGRYKSAPAQKARLIPPAGVDAARIIAIAEGAWLARDLINTPAGDMGPAALAEAARTLAERHGASIEVTVGDALLDANFPMIHAVGRAAAEAPRLIDIGWGDPAHPKVTLVGKGVCFDTGGLDLKPAAGMRWMKKDMGGAANTLALAHMIMARGLKVRLRVLIPAVENSISAASFRPGDVLTSRLGLTVEIGNTDAEGRLVLADALALASEEAPALLFDIATLTGAARVATGLDLPPYFTDDAALAAGLERASAQARDPIWRLPLYDPYDEALKSPIADIDNAPSGGFGGAITAALFLRRFVGAGIPWAHFDIHGFTNTAAPGRPKGGECMAARALFALLEARYG